MKKRPRLLVLSAVLPFPGHAGQQQRVRYKLEALREHFHITFLTKAGMAERRALAQKLQAYCDEVIILPSRYQRGPVTKIAHHLRGAVHSLQTGLKFSNYVLGRVEFTAERIAAVLERESFDCALFEYWHAVDSVHVFHAAGIPCVLDMHNVLWRSYTRQLEAKRLLPSALRERAVREYRTKEQEAWERFDALVTINAAEHAYVQTTLPKKTLFYAPMGIDLTQWPYGWTPAQPPRVAYYGGLGSAHNQRDAMRCHEAIMPYVWAKYPEVELWIVGSNPPPEIKALGERDRRVRVTGFVEEVQQVLRTMTCVLCPWTGRYGFRSRLIEVMALGVPVVTTPDAVYGMDLQQEQGLLQGRDDNTLAQQVQWLLDDAAYSEEQSRGARRQVEGRYGYDATYGRLACEMEAWLAAEPELAL